MLVNPDYPYVQVRVTIRGHSVIYRALLDTGFDGYLVLPETLESQLGAPDFQIKAYLADGTGKMRAQYRGAVEIVGLGLTYVARVTLLGNECLVGQGVIFDHGSQVIIEP